jgi:hypothetical protein
MMRHSPSIGFGCSVLLIALSAIPGAAVSLFLVVSLNPLVELFPANSGAWGIALGIAVMWGLVVAATIAVYAFGSVRRARRAVADEGVDTDWEDQRRYVPLAGSRALRAPPYPAYIRPEFQHEFQDESRDADYETGAELDYRLRRMEAMMASNLRPVDYGREGQARILRAAPPPLTGANLRRSTGGSGANLRQSAAPAGSYRPPRRVASR